MKKRIETKLKRTEKEMKREIKVQMEKEYKSPKECRK